MGRVLLIASTIYKQYPAVSFFQNRFWRSTSARLVTAVIGVSMGFSVSTFSAVVIVQIDFTEGRVHLLKKRDLNLANCEILPIKICNDAFCVPVRVGGNPAQWTRLDTGCDAALEWVVSGKERARTGQTSIALSGALVRYVSTSVQLGKQYFSAVTTGVHEEQIFPGEAGLLGNALLSKFRLTIDEPRSRVIFEKVR